MKITSIRSEGLVERITNNGLNEDDKNILIEIFKPKKYKHNPSPETVKRQSEWRRNKYRTDEEYRFNRIEQQMEIPIECIVFIQSRCAKVKIATDRTLNMVTDGSYPTSTIATGVAGTINTASNQNLLITKQFVSSDNNSAFNLLFYIIEILTP